MTLSSFFRPTRPLPWLAAAALLAGCAGPDAVAPPDPAWNARVDAHATIRSWEPGGRTFSLPLSDRDPALLYCPTDVARRLVKDVDPRLGGVVSIGGTAIEIPADAIPAPLDGAATVPVTVEMPASSYVEVNIRVGDAEHFAFALPVAITISYARCARVGDEVGPLDAWHIEPGDYTLLEHMGAADDRPGKRVTFFTDHLSGYALGTSRLR